MGVRQTETKKYIALDNYQEDPIRKVDCLQKSQRSYLTSNERQYKSSTKKKGQRRRGKRDGGGGKREK